MSSFFEIVSDSTDLETDRSDLSSITEVDDQFQFFEVSSRIRFINLSSDITSLNVSSLWSLFFFSKMLQKIAKHINLHVNRSRWWRKLRSDFRWFSNTTELKLKTYFEIRIYMNLHKESQISDYWNTHLNKSLHSLIWKAMTLNKYKNIDRFLYFFKRKENSSVFQRVSLFFTQFSTENWLLSQ